MKTFPCLAAALFIALSLPLLGAEPTSTNQLGQTRPTVPDVSRNANWHVYRFRHDGVEYLQVNALDDQPRLAVAVAHGTALVLPIGNDADRVRVKISDCGCGSRIQLRSNQPELLQTNGVAPVYQDPSVQIQAMPGPSGDAWQVEAAAAP